MDGSRSTDPEPTYIRTKEAAARLHLSPATIVRLIRAGKIKAHKKTIGADRYNSPYMVDSASVDAYNTARQQS
jgi:excisionase family DNA binding protein